MSVWGNSKDVVHVSIAEAATSLCIRIICVRRFSYTCMGLTVRRRAGSKQLLGRDPLAGFPMPCGGE